MREVKMSGFKSPHVGLGVLHQALQLEHLGLVVGRLPLHVNEIGVNYLYGQSYQPTWKDLKTICITKKHWFQIKIDFYVLNATKSLKKTNKFCLYHRKLGQFPAMRGLHLSPLWVGIFRQKKETHILIWATILQTLPIVWNYGAPKLTKGFSSFLSNSVLLKFVKDTKLRRS